MTIPGARSSSTLTSLCLGFCLVALTVFANAARGVEPARAEVDAWPEPPLQHAPWKAPNHRFEPEYVAAVNTLFAQGLADPRGCEYQEVVITTGDSAKGDVAQTKTRAWVLPKAAGETRDFAVCWNGLAYPVVSIGEAKDFRQDVLAALKPGARSGDRWFRTPSPGSVAPEAVVIAPGELDRLRVCLLLRLGEAELAARMSEAFEGRWEGASPVIGGIIHPYHGLASDWLWYLYDRTIAAQARGDDPMVVAGATLMHRVQSHLQAESRRLKKLQQIPLDNPYETLSNFGTEAADLLLDQEQRAKKTEPTLASGDRTGRLIQSLDQVAERQQMERWGLSLGNAAPVKELIQIGEPALMPLIACIENDRRLTRSVEYGRWGTRRRRVLPVRTAAYEAIKGILRTDRFGARVNEPTDADWRRTAATLRKFWEPYASLPKVERWYRVLQDDAAGPEAWLESAANIVLPVSASPEVSAVSPLERKIYTAVPNRTGERLHGDNLRARQAPSVTELLERRSKGLTFHAKSPSSNDSQTAVDFALCFSAWDPRAALSSVIREYFRCSAPDRDGKHRVHTEDGAENVPGYISQLTLARLRGDDSRAMLDFTAWVRTAGPAVTQFPSVTVLEPLWRNPQNPLVCALSKKLFGMARNPWTAAAREAIGTRGGGNSRLLALQEFRNLVIEVMRDRTLLGTASLKGDSIDVSTPNYGMRQGGYGPDPRAAKPSIDVPFRRCDAVAWALSSIDGAPRFEPYWSQRERDRAIPEMVAFLSRYGPSLQRTSLQERAYESGANESSIAFPPLLRPATAADVRQRRAIFALDPHSTCRLVTLPRVPMPARWTTLRSHPYYEQYWHDKANKSRFAVKYRQNGMVWQAEEVHENGKWKRYYGFVGSHRIAKVPAEDIEWVPLPIGVSP